MREFLKNYEGKEITKDDIEAIITEIGKEHTNLKNQNVNFKSEISDLKKQISGLSSEIETLNTTISEKDKSLENMQTLTNENKDLKADLKMSGSGIKKEFSEFVKTKVMSAVNDETDFDTAFENYKNENPQYFGETVVKKVQTSPTLNGGDNQPQTTNSIMNDVIRGARNN